MSNTPTKEMIERMQASLGHEGVYVGFKTVERALTAALQSAADTPAPQAHLVAVKALEWTGKESWKWAKTSFGAIYTLRPCLATNFLGKWLLSLEIERIGPLHDSEEAAKAAAQEDFERRVRAALAATATVPLSPFKAKEE